MVAVSGCFGSILYLQVEKYLNDGGKHPKMAFGAIILIDIVELIFLGICIMFGLYGQSEGGHGEEEEDVKEAGYMDDKAVEDVPFNQELEHIPEMSQEDFETSRGSVAELRPLRLSRESLRGSYVERDTFTRRPSRLKHSKISRHKPSVENLVFE